MKYVFEYEIYTYTGTYMCILVYSYIHSHSLYFPLYMFLQKPATSSQKVFMFSLLKNRWAFLVSLTKV